MLVNDSIKNVAGVGGNDGLSKFYGRIPGESLQDAEKRFLSRNESGYKGTSQDIWRKRLTDLGYTGTIDDMQAAYWAEDKIIPSELSGLKMWCRYGTGITETGSGVSQWDDVSGNSNHLKQTTDADRPSKESDGSILFDSSHLLKTDAFTLNQPETVYILVYQRGWTDIDIIIDGNASSSGAIYQSTTSPSIRQYAGTAVNIDASLPISTYGVVSAVFNGANSYLQIDDNAPSGPSDPGPDNMSGVTVGANGAGDSQHSNIIVKEICVFNTAHDAATRTKVINYLSNVGWL